MPAGRGDTFPCRAARGPIRNLQGPTLHNQTPSLHCAGALKGPECHQRAAGLSLAKARCGAGGHLGGHSSPLPGVLHFSKGQRGAGGPRSVAPVKQNYNYIHPLPPGPWRAVKYSCFLPLRGEGLLGASPPLRTALQSASWPAPCLLLPSSGAGWEPRGAGHLGHPCHTQAHPNPDLPHLWMWRHLITSFLSPSP